MLQASLEAHGLKFLLGKQTENGILCEVLESVPLDEDDSVYRKRIGWIDPATAIVQSELKDIPAVMDGQSNRGRG